LHLLFIDYKQAYNSINREVLWNALITFGIPAKIVKMIKLCMSKTRCIVRFNHYISDEFEVKTGLQQRDALSPMFFNTAIENVVRKTQNKYSGLNLEENRRQYRILAYADDIIVLGSDSQEVKASIKELIINKCC
jgi:sorting nexin-29